MATIRSMHSAVLRLAVLDLLFVAFALTLFLRAASSRTGGGVHGFTLDMSRGKGCGFGQWRLRSARFANLSFSMESRVIRVVALPWSSCTVTLWLLAACVTLASCARECWDNAAALLTNASAS